MISRPNSSRQSVQAVSEEQRDDKNISGIRALSSSTRAKAKSALTLVGIIFAADFILKTTKSSSRSLSAGKSIPRTSQLSNELSNIPEKPCTIWFAPSSLKAVKGYGIYTTRDLHNGEAVLGGPDGLSIPLVSPDDYSVPKGDLKREWMNLWGNFVWGRGVPDHVNYEAGPGVYDYQIGFGSLPNHHCHLASLDPMYPVKAPYHDALLSRHASPGAGAITYSKGREFAVDRFVAAGNELFMSYGYCNHDTEGMPDWTAFVHTEADFREAAKIIWHGLRREEREAEGGPLGTNMPDLEIPAETSTLVRDLLPKTPAEWESIRAAPLVKPRDLVTYLATHQGLNKRTKQWIESNGICMETIVPRKSLIPHAGQGGFLQHTVSKGEIIVPAPLLQIMDKDVLALYDENDKDKKKRIGTQLVLNYCFGHPRSTLLLCPMTNAVLINHCSHRKKQCGPEGPNAEVKWSSAWDAKSDSWRNFTIEELSHQKDHGLAFEIVALRDLSPGIEVTIDYGMEFEEAWENHVRMWEKGGVERSKHQTISPDNWITAEEANEQGGHIIDRLVTNDLRTTADDPYLFTGCQYWESDDDHDDVYQNENNNWKYAAEEVLLNQYSSDGSEYVYSTHFGYAKHGDMTHWPCSVLRDEGGGQSYLVRIHQNRWENEMPWETNSVPRFLTNYPRASIRYFVKPYASDQHLNGVFRHPIGIRDEIFPPQWKNIKSS